MSLRRALAGGGILWQQLEQRWNENPGYVAAATAGTIGILLALLLMINAGIDWFKGPPDELAGAVAQADIEDDELGDPADEVMRGLRRDYEDDAEDPFASRRATADEPDDMDDPFERPIKFDRSKSVDIADDPMEDDPLADDSAPDEPMPDNSLADKLKTDETAPEELESDADEPDLFESPAPIVIVDKTPNQNIDSDEDEGADAPVSDPILERPAPKIDLGLADNVNVDEEIDEEEAIISNEMAADTEERETASESAPKEPAFLKTNGERETEIAEPDVTRRIETEDEIIRREARPARSREAEPDLKAEPANPRSRDEQPARRDQPRWQQQRTQPEPPPPEARRSRAVETVVVPPRQASEARRSESTSAPRERNRPSKSSADLPLKLSITGPANVGLGETCSYVLTMTNTGTTVARNLVLSIELPPGLVHDVSQSLEQDVESIPAGGSHRSLLNLRTTQPGQSTIHADIVAGQQVVVKLTARVQVGSTPAARVVKSAGYDDVR